MNERRHCVELDGTCAGITLAVEADGQVRCLSHATDPVRIRRREERNAKGGYGRLRTLPADTAPPRFSTPGHVRRYAERLAHLVTTGQLNRQVAETGLRAASLGLQVHQLRNQERLTDALLRLEHGGVAVQMLAMLTTGLADGKRRPLPGRVHALPVPPEPAS
jgi:hypothetical protein